RSPETVTAPSVPVHLVGEGVPPLAGGADRATSIRAVAANASFLIKILSLAPVGWGRAGREHLLILLARTSDMNAPSTIKTEPVVEHHANTEPLLHQITKQ